MKSSFKKLLVRGLATSMFLAAAISPISTFAASAYSASPAARQAYEMSDKTYMPAYQKADFKVKLNGNPIDLGVDILVSESRSFLPLRALSNAIQADSVDWDSEYKAAKISRGGVDIEVVRGSQNVVKDRLLLDRKMEQKLFITNEGLSYAPLRSVSELFEGVSVDWDNDTRTVLITTTQVTQTPTTPQPGAFDNEITVPSQYQNTTYSWVYNNLREQGLTEEHAKEVMATVKSFAPTTNENHEKDAYKAAIMRSGDQAAVGMNMPDPNEEGEWYLQPSKTARGWYWNGNNWSPNFAIYYGYGE